MAFPQSLTEMRITREKLRMFLGSRVRPACKANITAIYEPSVYTMGDPQYLTTL
jgi:hypothetical protein